MIESVQAHANAGNYTADVCTKDTPSIVQTDALKAKTYRTMQARAELKGRTLQKIGSGYLLSRWGCVLHCTDLDVVEQHLQQLGA